MECRHFHLLLPFLEMGIQCLPNISHDEHFKMVTKEVRIQDTLTRWLTGKTGGSFPYCG